MGAVLLGTKRSFMFSCQGEVSSKVLGHPWAWTITGRKELTYLVLCDRVVGLGWGRIEGQ